VVSLFLASPKHMPAKLLDLSCVKIIKASSLEVNKQKHLPRGVRPSLTERGYSQEKQMRCLENPIKTVQTGHPPRLMAKFPVQAEESSRFTGQSALLHRYSREKMMVCGGKDFPCPHQLHNYSHWGVRGRKLSIWEVLTHDPMGCTTERLGIWWSLQIPGSPGLITALFQPRVWLRKHQRCQTTTISTVYPHCLQNYKNK